MTTTLPAPDPATPPRAVPHVPARDRARAWFVRWNDVLPLFLAEFVVWLGFGGLLPVLPLYFTEQGIDLATLGLVVAAWPAARLVAEPFFGWLADRTARVPLMVVGLLASGLFEMLPLVLVGPVPFTLLRAGAGIGAAIYDPAARGYLTDATPPERRGEAFGLYGAAQMGGLLFGPTIGAIGAGLFGGIGFVFIFSAVTAVLAAIVVAVRVREHPSSERRHVTVAAGLTEFPSDVPYLGAGRSDRTAATDDEPSSVAPPTRLLNRGLVAALILTLGGNFASGTYEVIWSLFLQGLGADLALIGFTFAMFGLPILLFSPFAGRIVDRRGSFRFIVIGSLLPAITGILYTFLTDPRLAVPLILVEATGFAFLLPALFTVVARSSPVGRSSTAQGLYGAAGTLGFIVASLVAGWLAAMNILYPFYVFAAVMVSSLVLGLIVGGSRLRARPARADPTVVAVGPV